VPSVSIPFHLRFRVSVRAEFADSDFPMICTMPLETGCHRQAYIGYLSIVGWKPITRAIGSLLHLSAQ
jgi:hypothetical protein